MPPRRAQQSAVRPAAHGAGEEAAGGGGGGRGRGAPCRARGKEGPSPPPPPPSPPPGRGRATRLDDLPTDVLSVILAHLPCAERFSLCVVCKAFARALDPPAATWECVDVRPVGVAALCTLRQAAGAGQQPDPGMVAWATRLLRGAPLFKYVGVDTESFDEVGGVFVGQVLGLLLGSPPPAPPALSPALRALHFTSPAPLSSMGRVLPILFRGSPTLTQLRLSLTCPTFPPLERWRDRPAAFDQGPVSTTLRSLHIGPGWQYSRMGDGFARSPESNSLIAVGLMAWRAPNLRELVITGHRHLHLPHEMRAVGLTRLSIEGARLVRWVFRPNEPLADDNYGALAASLQELRVSARYGPGALAGLIRVAGRLSRVDLVADGEINDVRDFRELPDFVLNKASLRSLTIRIDPGLRAGAHAAAIMQGSMFSRLTEMSSLTWRNTSVRRLDVPRSAAGRPIFPALRSLDLGAQLLPALPELKGHAPLLGALTLGFPAWGEAPLTGPARAALDEHGVALGEEGHAADVRKPFDVVAWSMPTRAFPSTLARVHLSNMTLTADGLEARLSKGQARARATPAALARALATVMSRTTVPGLRHLTLVNVGTANPVIRALLDDGGAILRAAYEGRLHVVGECLWTPAGYRPAAPPPPQQPPPVEEEEEEEPPRGPHIPDACRMQ